MKLVRYGNPGKEKPGLIDADGKLRDLSKVIKDVSPDQLSDKALAKLAKLREQMAPRAEAVQNLMKMDENRYLRDVVPNSLTNAEIEAEIQRMAARAQASQPEIKKADGGAINYNTAPDMSDGGRIIQGAPFKHGGKVNMTANRDAMFMELSNKKLKRK